jgi:hypothetical protein
MKASNEIFEMKRAFEPGDLVTTLTGSVGKEIRPPVR